MIEVTLECISAQNQVPVDLQDTIPPETEWRTAYIKTKDIMAIYPDNITGGTHIAFNTDSSWLVKEDIKSVKKLIENETQSP